MQHLILDLLAVPVKNKPLEVQIIIAIRVIPAIELMQHHVLVSTNIEHRRKNFFVLIDQFIISQLWRQKGDSFDKN